MAANQPNEGNGSRDSLLEQLIQSMNSRLAALHPVTPDPSRWRAVHPFFVAKVGRQTDKVLSPPFMVRSMQWRIVVIPSMAGLGFYVQCLGMPGSPNWSCKASIEFRLVNNRDGEEDYVKGPIQHLFNAEEDDYGYAVFIRWPQLVDISENYVICRGVMLEVKIVADAPQGLKN